MAKQKKEAEPAEAAKPKAKKPATKKTTVKASKPNRPKSQNPIGRPKLPQETRDIILDNLRKGNSKRDSCLAAKVSASTFFEWQVKAGEFKEQGVSNDYTDFMEQIEEAMGEARRFALSCWQKHLPNDWRASVTYLERTDPDSWAPKQKIDITSNGQSVGPMIVPIKEEDK